MRGPVERGAIALNAVCAVLSVAQAIAEKTPATKPNRVEFAYVDPVQRGCVPTAATRASVVRAQKTQSP